jgi:hypothetical protein
MAVYRGRSTWSLGVTNVTFRLSRRARPWILAGIAAAALYGACYAAIQINSRSDLASARVLIAASLPAVGEGNTSKLLPLFVVGAIPEDTREIEARIKSWHALGTFRTSESVQLVDWDWNSGRYYHVQGRYVSVAHFQNGEASVYWTWVRKPDGTLGLWDVNVGSVSESP